MGGLIPAHAGKTLSTRQTPSHATAHPRSRGENPALCGGPGAMGGSSPLTRGKQLQARNRVRVVGLIPAHAGKTNKTCNKTRAPAAHPRSRGENFSIDG